MNKRAMKLIRRYARFIGMTDKKHIKIMKRNWKDANHIERRMERERVEAEMAKGRKK